MPSLFVIRGHDQGRKFDLDSDRLTLGREPSNSIQLRDREVSRHHAELRREGNTYHLADLNSSNGSFVNSQQVKSHELASGDHVQIGRTVMLFTGAKEEGSSRLQDMVGIIEETAANERSQIVRSMSHREGSQLLTSHDPAASPWLTGARDHLEIIYRTALAVSQTLDIDQLLHRIMQLIFEWVDADHGCIMLAEAESSELRPKVHLSRHGQQKPDKLVISRSILDYVMEKNQGVLTSDARDDERFDAGASILQHGIREAICVPMQGRYDVVGVIYIDSTTQPQKIVRAGRPATKFNEEHLQLMIAIAHQAALAVEDTRHYSAMVQAERLAAMGQTIATLSHHIKNVVQGIRASSYLIEDGLKRHDETMIRKGWVFVERNQQRISDLVMDMLAFSTEREPEMDLADLNTVVEEVVQLMEGRASDAEVELTLDLDRALPPLSFDAEGLHRAVLNVVTNAIDACEGRPEGAVTVSTEYLAEEDLARIVVQDNGPGITDESLEKIFTLFVSTKGSRGTGLGLTVSQKILQEHGGEIRVESVVDQGSRFILELPTVLPESGDAGQTLG